jgi:hypothetical protein
MLCYVKSLCVLGFLLAMMVSHTFLIFADLDSFVEYW